MHFDDTAEEAAYRAAARGWLAEQSARFAEAFAGGSDVVMDVQSARDWQSAKAAAGYACIAWPVDWGGQGGPAWRAVVFGQEEALIVHRDNPLSIGLGMCVPTVMAAGRPADRERFGPRAARGEDVWCQLFSEPGSGSDLAAARTRAVRDGDGWRVSGQKVWTSGAHYSDFGLLLARTDPMVPKHKGLTMFWLDMRTPGVEVRRIHQMSGGSGFNEVFFSDVRLEDFQRVGEVGEGWGTSLVTLMNERLAIGENGVGATWREMLELMGALKIEDSASRERIADWFVKAEGLKYTRYRSLTALSRGNAPGPENSIGKLVWAPLMQEIAQAGLDLMDQYGILVDPTYAPLAGVFQSAQLRAPGQRLAGGTDEILKNIIAERVLGLPQDIRVDKNIAFKDVPRNN